MANQALDEGYDLTGLCEAAGVTTRTVRYYIQQGLLPAPALQGPATRYGRTFVDRLKLIRHLQREHIPLAEIRKRLEVLDDASVRRLVATPPARKPSSAVDYVRAVLGAGTGQAPSRRREEPATLAPHRAQWERITLAPDVELHVRRPLTREQNRRVEKLLAVARQTFAERP